MHYVPAKTWDNPQAKSYPASWLCDHLKHTHQKQYELDAWLTIVFGQDSYCTNLGVKRIVWSSKIPFQETYETLCSSYKFVFFDVYCQVSLNFRRDKYYLFLQSLVLTLTCFEIPKFVVEWASPRWKLQKTSDEQNYQFTIMRFIHNWELLISTGGIGTFLSMCFYLFYYNIFAFTLL